MINSAKIIAASVLIAATFSTNSFAQQAYASTTKLQSNERNAIDPLVNNSIKSNDATNAAITAKFAALFPNSSNQVWSSTGDNSWVSFLNEGRKANASFTSKGKMSYIITDCTMENLPFAFSKTIKNEYASYSLFNAIEIKAHGAVVYQAILEDSKGFITLKYTSDGVEQIQQVKKQ